MSLFRRVTGPLLLVFLGVAALACAVSLRQGFRGSQIFGTTVVGAASGALGGSRLNPVSGIVVNAATGRPIKGARVVSRYSKMFDSREYVSEAYTNSRGEFTVKTTLADDGQVPLEVSKPGYMGKLATGTESGPHRTIALIPAAR